MGLSFFVHFCCREYGRKRGICRGIQRNIIRRWSSNSCKSTYKIRIIIIKWFWEERKGIFNRNWNSRTCLSPECYCTSRLLYWQWTLPNFSVFFKRLRRLCSPWYYLSFSQLFRPCYFHWKKKKWFLPFSDDKSPAMDWKTRHKIAIGTAKGLHYLHKSCPRRIIHRDIKASNVLLTTDFEPQVPFPCPIPFLMDSFLQENMKFH